MPDEQTMIELYQLALPSGVIGQPEEGLYVHSTPNARYTAQDEKVFVSSVDGDEAHIDFDTYFNAFALAKWQRYTILSNLSARLRLTGKGTVSCLSVDAENNETVLLQRSFSHTTPEDLYLEIPPCDAVIVFIRVATRTLCGMEDASFFTKVPPTAVTPISLSLVICTFKREAYVKNTLAAISRELETYPQLQSCISIKLVDNGQSLDASVLNNLPGQLYYNVNAGGAGGFARGMLETLEDKQYIASHVLLMDDDIELPLGALYKTFSLLRLIRETYAQAFVGGAMLDGEKRNELFASAETLDGPCLLKRAYHTGSDLSDRRFLVQHELPLNLDSQHQAWWYCTIPVPVIRKIGLPLPLFFQGDDIEFSHRSQCKVIHSNGIGVWHEPFHKKMSNSKQYFQARNSLVLGACFPEQGTRVLASLLRNIALQLFLFNYAGVAAARGGIEAFLRGPDQFFNPDLGQQALAEAAMYNSEPLVAIGDIPKQESTTRFPLWKKAIMVATVNGHFLPPLFSTSQGHAIAPYLQNLDSLYLKKKLFFPLAEQPGKGYIRVRSLEALGMEAWKAGLCLLRLLIAKNKLSHTYRKCHTELVAENFWKTITNHE